MDGTVTESMESLQSHEDSFLLTKKRTCRSEQCTELCQGSRLNHGLQAVDQ